MIGAYQGTYQATLKCLNCGDLCVVEIPKGVPMLTYCRPPNESDKQKCQRCGCRTLSPAHAG